MEILVSVMSVIQRQVHRQAENAQPLVLNYVKGTLALAHNGKSDQCSIELRQELEYTGAIFQTTIDSEVIAYHIARERLNAGTAEEAVRSAMQKDQGCLCTGGHASPDKADRSKRSVWIQAALHR